MQEKWHQQIHSVASLLAVDFCINFSILAIWLAFCQFLGTKSKNYSFQQNQKVNQHVLAI